MRTAPFSIVLTVVLGLVGCGSKEISREYAATAIKPNVERNIIKKELLLGYMIDQDCPYINDSTIARNIATIKQQHKSLIEVGLIKEVTHVQDIRTTNWGNFYPGNEGIKRKCPDADRDNTYVMPTGERKPWIGNIFSSLYILEPSEPAKPFILSSEKVVHGPFGGHVDVKSAQPVKTLESTKVVVIAAKFLFNQVTGIRGNDNAAVVEYSYSMEPTSFGVALGIQKTVQSAAASFQKYDDGWRLTGTGCCSASGF